MEQYDPPKRTGRKRIDACSALDAIIFRLRSGCQWNQLPHEFPDDSSVHRTFQRWIRLGLFDHLWAALLNDCAKLGGVNWEMLSRGGNWRALGLRTLLIDHFIQNGVS